MQVVELRERRGLTQEERAKRTGPYQGDISRIERGAANPTERTLLRIGGALGAAETPTLGLAPWPVCTLRPRPCARRTAGWRVGGSEQV